MALTLLVLQACDSAEERAEGHYQSGLELLESGDVSRALLEFRNVFQLDESHREARATYARVLLEEGRVRQAARQYLRLIEQYPDDKEGQIVVATLAAKRGDWETARRHTEAAEEIAPDDPRVPVVRASVDYQAALADRDESQRRAVARRAETLKATVEDHEILSRLIIDNALREQDAEAALAEIDAALEQTPRDKQLYMMRLSVLNGMNEMEAVEEQLLDMVKRFPKDDNFKSLLVRFYTNREEFDKAEAYLRSLFDPESENPGDYVGFIRFINEAKGRDAAMAELETAINVSPVPWIFEALRASLEFERGETEASIATMERIIGEDPDAERRQSYKVTLARMLQSTGNEVGARRLIEEVLAENGENVEANKMSASWMIEDDKADDAIITLRAALEQSPEDTEILTLMAEAHARNGNRQLARDMLALAVETSNNAPTETLRYANVLIGEGQYRSAEDLLIRALRVQPGNLDLLRTLGQLHANEEDWPRVQQVEETLRRVEDPEYQEAADVLRFARLRGQQRTDEALGLLESLREQDQASLGPIIGIIETHISEGRFEEAVRTAEEALAKDPDNLGLRYIDAAAREAAGDTVAALKRYKALLKDIPQNERLWLQTIRAQTALGQHAEARETLEEGLAQLPNAPNLLWAKASILEQDRDYEGAIKVYEELYAAASDSVIVANNLASMLSTQRSDPESLERAYQISRRLRDLEVPAFQDTYGWIAYLRGNYEEAVAHLEPGAEGLPNDPLAQYHLGKAYAAVNRPGDALERLQAALEIAGDDPRPQFEDARQVVQELTETLQQQ